jgi:dihydropteroate synthase
VNDVSAGLADRRMLGVVARAGAGIVLMHRRGTPRTMRRLAVYRDVVAEVTAQLARRITAARRAGIEDGNLAIDPGIGFAKTAAHNLRLLRRLDRLVALGLPVVVGVSRKSFLGTLLDLPVDQRVEGTVAASLLAVAAGARIVRVHDVPPMVRALRVAEAIWGAT